MNTQHTNRTTLLWGCATLCLALLLVTGPGRAAAQPSGPGAEPAGGSQFRDLDKDGDGELTPVEAAEARAVRRMGFDRLDTNRDGRLTPDEFAAPPRPGRDCAPRSAADGPRGPQGPGPRGHGMQRGPGDPHGEGPPQGPRPPRFEELDTDGDGRLSSAEAESIPPVRHLGFETLDRDGDGLLSREELPAPPRRPEDGFGGPQPGRRGERHGHGPHPGAGPQEGPGRGTRPPRFEELDRDGDGKLSRAEAETIPPVRDMGFDALDKDGDGLLSREELSPPPHHGPGGPGGPGGTGDRGVHGPHGAR